jgi:exopolysaccharide production protein ExoQ
MQPHRAQAAAFGAQPAAHHQTDWPLALGAVFMLLTYSQAWVGLLLGQHGGEAGPDTSSLIRNLYLPAYGVGLLMFFGAAGRTAKAALHSPLLLLLVAVAGASVMWSIDPDSTTRRTVALIFTTLGGLILASRFRWSEIAELIGTTFAVLGVLSLLVCIFVPSIGIMTTIFPGAWRGLWLEKNALGGNMAMAFVIFVAAAFLNPHRRWTWTGFAVLAVFLVLMSTSKTSLVSLLLGAAAMGAVWFARRNAITGVIAVWLGVVVAALIAAVVLYDRQAVFDALGKDATLTGRTRIWTAALHQIEKRPEYGYGYGAVWDDTSAWAPLAAIRKEADFRPAHAHSSWIELLLGLGRLGLTVWSLWFAEIWLRALRSVFRTPGAYLTFPFLVVYSLRTLTESVTLIWNDLHWVMFVALAVKLVVPDLPPPEPVYEPPMADRRRTSVWP